MNLGSEPQFSEPQVSLELIIGFLGHAVATRLGGIGSSVIMPVTSENNYRHSEHIK